MIKIITIIGARPQIIKASAINRCIKKNFQNQIQEVLLHTGQHYDYEMSKVFFEELELPSPDYNLGVGSGMQGKQTAEMIAGIESIIDKEKPQAIMVYGDTNSTLAASVAAIKLHIPVIHIEAGLRSFNKAMPEEINRIITDHCSTLLFSPTITGINNLFSEGIIHNDGKTTNADKPKVFHCGDVMYDNALYFSRKAQKKSHILQSFNLEPGKYILLTLHRGENTDKPEKLNKLSDTIKKLLDIYKGKIIFPIHPRTNKVLETENTVYLKSLAYNNDSLILTKPVSYFDMLILEKNAGYVITDSGGVQKEAFFFKKPCLILRDETEWTEIIDSQTAALTGLDPEKIISSFVSFEKNTPKNFPSIFGNGNAAEYICQKIMNLL